MNPLIALRQRLRRAIVGPVLDRNEQLLQSQEATLQANKRALEQFAAAMSQYAEQLARHTEAVKSMASAAQELRDTVVEMNRMLGHFRVSQRSKAEYYRENQDAGWGPKEP